METQGGVDGERLVGSFARQRTPAGVSMPACANGDNRRQAENGTAQYYRRGEKSKGHLATYSTTAKINCMEELNNNVSRWVTWLLSYVPQAPPLCHQRKTTVVTIKTAAITQNIILASDELPLSNT